MSLGATDHASGTADALSMTYFKETIPLGHDARLVAIQFDDVEATPRVIDRHGLAGVVGTLPHGGWRLVEIARGGSDLDRGSLEDRLMTDAEVAFVSPVLLDERGGSMLVTPDVFVQFTEGTPHEAADAILHGEGIQVVERDYRGLAGVYRARSSSKSGRAVLESMNALAGRDDVVFAEPDYVRRIYPAGVVIPNDPEFPNCWGLHNTGGPVNGWNPVPDIDMNLPEAWIHEQGHAGVLVAVLDNGVQQDHPDINQETPGHDMTALEWMGFNGGPIFQYDNHGTPVAGCISGIMQNGLGALGVAPGCRTISVKIAYDADAAEGWTSQSSWVANGVLVSLGIGARITNSSFHMGPSALVTLAFDQTYNAGVMHFVSAGNDSMSSLSFPASVGTTNAISAITPLGELADFSNTGPGLHFSAPGVSVRAADRTGAAGYADGDVTWFGGTSAASPYAAGVAALAMSARPSLTPVTCGSLLATTARDLGPGGYDTSFGFGMPDAHAAVVTTLFGDDCPGSGSCLDAHGFAGCSDAECCFVACDIDPFCCSNWDAACVGLAAVTCYGCGGSGTGDCFAPNGTPSCQETECCVAVCTIDPFCCTAEWDGECALIAFDNCGPENDVCVNATPVAEGAHFFSTVDAHSEVVSPIQCGVFGPDVWFRFIATCDGTLLVNTCNSTAFDTKIALYEIGPIGTACPGGPFGSTYLACNDDAPGCNGGSSVQVSAEVGTEYAIRIGGGEGSGTFSIYCGVPGDFCALPQSASNGPNPFSTIGAGTDGAAHATCDFCCGDDQIWSDVWFAYEAPCDGTLDLDVCDADFDTKIAVYTNSEGIGYTCGFAAPQALLVCNDDQCGLQSSASLEVEAGRSYRIRVGGYQGAQGVGTLTLTCTPGQPCPADIDGDSQVGPIDLALVLAGWGFCPNCPADINGDNVVDAQDLGAVLSAWGDSCP